MSPACSKCGSPLYRTARKPLERLLSLVVPLGRYYCRNPQCGWQGLRRRHPRHPEPTPGAAAEKR